MPTSGMPKGRYLDLGDRGTTYIRERREHEGAPTVMLLHGLTATGRLNWFTSIDEVAKDFNVAVMDHRGHGRGIRPRGAFRLQDCADDVVAAMDALDIEKAVMVGYSMGGPIGQLVWKRHPDRVTGAVMCSTSDVFPHALAANLVFAFAPWSLIPRGVPNWVGQGLERLKLGSVGDLAMVDPRSIGEAVRALGNYDARPWIGAMDVPTSALITTHDTLVPVALQRAMARRMPGCEVTELPAGHLVCVSHPTGFARDLSQACQSVVQRSMQGSALDALGA